MRKAGKRVAQHRKEPVPIWRAPEEVACRGEDVSLFFKAEGEGKDERAARVEKAKELCSWCPFTRECLEHALEEEKAGGRYGIRGGLTEEERALRVRQDGRRKASQARRDQRARDRVARKTALITSLDTGFLDKVRIGLNEEGTHMSGSEIAIPEGRGGRAAVPRRVGPRPGPLLPSPRALGRRRARGRRTVKISAFAHVRALLSAEYGNGPETPRPVPALPLVL